MNEQNIPELLFYFFLNELKTAGRLRNKVLYLQSGKSSLHLSLVLCLVVNKSLPSKVVSCIRQTET